MRTQTLICLVALVATLVGLHIATPSRARACSCLPPTVESSYRSATDVAFVDVQRSYVTGDTRYYIGRVLRTFKGCLQANERVLLTTSATGDACGTQLGLRRYLINGTAAGSSFGTALLSISLCSYDRLLSTLSEHDRQFLNARTLCCAGVCSCVDGSQPLQCFVDPCFTAPDCGEGECVANYCGGCNAEFYDTSGNAVCQDPSECKSDGDCPDNSWCRQMQSEGSAALGYECAPFVGLGSRCNGFTPPWLYERCQPDLTCDTPDFVADAPGICRTRCEAEKDCKENSYCASDKLCDEDGACERDVDCNLPGNVYAQLRCVGHGVCSAERQCNWQCGVRECLDLSGLDTGPCNTVLGWAVVDGGCSELKGCSAGDFKVFPSGDECRKTCDVTVRTSAR